MSLGNENRKNLIKLLASAAAFCMTSDGFSQMLRGTAAVAEGAAQITGFGFAAPIIKGVVNTVAGNLTSTHFEKLVNIDHLLDWVENHDPGSLNHDLEKMLYRSSISAFKLVKSLYIEQLPNSEAIWDAGRGKVRAKRFLKSIEREIVGEHLNLYIEIDSNDLEHSGEIISIIARNIESYPWTKVSADELAHFVDYFRQKMPFCLDLAIKEELKTNERCYRAYQLSILDALNAGHTKLLEGQQAILSALETGRIDVLPRTEMLTIINQQAEQIYQILGAHTEEMKNLIVQELACFREELEQFIRLDGKRTRNLLHRQHQGMRNHVTSESEATRRLIEDKLTGTGTLIPKFIGGFRTHPDQLVGRDDDLAAIQLKLSEHRKPLVVKGLAGVGKTSLLKLYLETKQQSFDHIVWIELGKTELNVYSQISHLEHAYDVLLKAFSNIAPTIGITFNEKVEPDEQFNVICDKLQNLSGNNLLVIDNAGLEVHRVRLQLPGSPYWNVLLSSKVEIPDMRHYNLDVLDPELAKELFQRHAKRTFAGYLIEKLLKVIGYHTLTIELIAKTLYEDRRLDLKQLISNLRAGKLSEARYIPVSAGLSDQTQDFLIHLMVTFDFSPLSDLEKQVLKTWYFLIPGPYKFEQIISYFEHWENQTELPLVLRDLEKKGWIKFEPTDDSYELHRLVRLVISYKMPVDYADTIPLIDFYYNNLLERNTSVSVAFLLNALHDIFPDTYKMVVMCWVAGGYYASFARPVQAEKLLLRALSGLNNGATSLEPITDKGLIMERLAELYMDYENLDRAAVLLEDARKYYRDLINNGDRWYRPMLAKIYFWIGELNDLLDQKEIAKDNFIQSCNLYYQELTEEYEIYHQDRVFLLDKSWAELSAGMLLAAEKTIGQVLENLARNDDHDEEYRRAEYFSCYIVLAEIHHDRGELDQAEELLLQAIEINEWLISQSTDVAEKSNFVISLLRLGDIYSKTNREALALAQVKLIFDLMFYEGSCRRYMRKHQKNFNELITSLNLDPEAFIQEQLSKTHTG